VSAAANFILLIAAPPVARSGYARGIGQMLNWTVLVIDVSVPISQPATCRPLRCGVVGRFCSPRSLNSGSGRVRTHSSGLQEWFGKSVTWIACAQTAQSAIERTGAQRYAPVAHVLDILKNRVSMPRLLRQTEKNEQDGLGKRQELHCCL